MSRFLTNPIKQHWEGVKWILSYLKVTSHHCLCFGDNNIILEAFTHVDMVGYVDTRKSTIGYLDTFAGAVVSWVSRL